MREKLMRAAIGLMLCLSSTTWGWAEAKTEAIRAALVDGRLDVASDLIRTIPEQQGIWLGELALAQFQAGGTDDAKSTLRRIQNVGELSRAASKIANQAQGGGTGADFDSLINLITSTVEPDSWDDVGGPGTVLAFPGGVDVDANGVLANRTKRKASSGKSLDLLRERIRTQRDNSSEADSKNVHRVSDLRMVSLPRLERELMIRLAVGEEPSTAMAHLAGLKEIQYVFLLDQDVVIAGPAAGWQLDGDGIAVTATGRPVLLLDDLISMLHCTRRNRGQFGCSIDPKRENLAATQAFLARPTGTLKPSQTRKWVERIRDTLGLQDIRVYGIDPSGHAARVIVEADYHMKLLGMGLEPTVDGLTSYLGSIQRRDVPKGIDVLRWWFTLKPASLRQNQSGSAFEFATQVVRLQCKNELISRDGSRTGTEDASELNQQFAHQFTQHFEQLRREYPIYWQLENLFRMSLVAGLLQTPEVQATKNWKGHTLADIVQPAQGIAPKEVLSIVNHRVIDRRHVVVGVSGGVTVNVPSALKTIPTAASDRAASAVQAARTRNGRESAAWWWDL